ncbi:MAG: VIT domain-containing protein [Verrucomicrobiota bacterium]
MKTKKKTIEDWQTRDFTWRVWVLGLGAVICLGVILTATSSGTPQRGGPSGTMPGGGNAEETLSPYFQVLTGPGDDAEGVTVELPLRSTDVNVEISGVIAHVTVRQMYVNTGEVPIEALYVFPASTRAAVHGLEMQLADRVVRAEIQEKKKAKAKYEKAKAEGKSASLLEQKRPNVFQMNVANIMPGDEIGVTLVYTELLLPTDQVYEFVYPTVVGPRYSNMGADEPGAEEENWVANPYLKDGVETPSTFSMEVRLDTGLPLQDVTCASHGVQVNYESNAKATVGLDAGETHGGDRDYVLRYRLAGREVASGLLLYEGEDEAENFFLLNVQPPARGEIGKMPPREYVFIVDVSGSMRGFPLETTKGLMRDLFGHLGPKDRFNLMLFAGGSEVLSERSVPATKKNLTRAIRFLDETEGGGGTELLPALERALALPREENSGLSRSVVILTDGYVHVEREAFDLVRNHLDQGNVFSFGIGSSVNRFLIEGLARVGQGEPFVVTGPGEAKATAARFGKYVSSPVLTEVKLESDEFEIYDVEPASIPDAFADRPLAIFGKWNGKPEGELILTGFAGGTERELRTDVAEAANDMEHGALPYLWARSRVATLSDYIQLKRTDEDVAEVTNLGLTYNLLTPFTSFVAVDEVVRREAEEGYKVAKQPSPLPKGVSNSAVGGGAVSGGGMLVATTPEPGGAGMVLLAVMVMLGVRRRPGWRSGGGRSVRSGMAGC